MLCKRKGKVGTLLFQYISLECYAWGFPLTSIIVYISIHASVSDDTPGMASVWTSEDHVPWCELDLSFHPMCPKSQTGVQAGQQASSTLSYFDDPKFRLFFFFLNSFQNKGLPFGFFINGSFLVAFSHLWSPLMSVTPLLLHVFTLFTFLFPILFCSNIFLIPVSFLLIT